MKNLDDILGEEIAETLDLTEENHAGRAIRVTVDVSLDGICNDDLIEVTFSPSVETLLRQVEKLFHQIHACARGLMLQKLSDKFKEVGATGVFPSYKHETIQANADILIAGASVTFINGVEVDFEPSAVAETAIFEYEKVEEAKKALVMQLLTGFAELGGH